MKKIVSVFGVGAMVVMMGMGSGFAQSQTPNQPSLVVAGAEKSGPAGVTAAEKGKSTAEKAVKGAGPSGIDTPKPPMPGPGDKVPAPPVDKVLTPDVKPGEAVKPGSVPGMKPGMEDMKGKMVAPEEPKKP